MTVVNGSTTVSRVRLSVEEPRAQANGAARTVGNGDQFELTQGQTTRGEAAAGTNPRTVIRGDTGTVATVVNGTHTALNTVRETIATTQPKVDPKTVVQPGDAMSRAAAIAAVVDIYTQAFPGIGFTESELAKSIDMLQHGRVTIEEMTAKVQEGARLVNDPNAMADQVGYAPEAAPDQHSSLTQKLRMDRLATLMEMGYLPEGKFNIVGGFAFHSFSEMNTSRFVSAFGAQTAAAPDPSLNVRASRGMTGMTRDMQRSMDRYKLTAKDVGSDVNGDDDKSGSTTKRGVKGSSGSLGKTLIRGARTNENPTSNSTTFSGERSTHQVVLTSADISSLKAASNDLATSSGLQMSPVMLDLNHDGRLGTTGATTAKDRIDNQVHATVNFDLDGDGDKEHVEWMNGDGDGMLVDDRDGGATAAMHGNGEIDGKRLFGDEGGKYANGYEKMKKLDANGDGKLSGRELDGLKTWIDDGDAKIEEGELKTLVELGVTEIDLKMVLTANDRGEMLMRSTFTQNGEQHVSEDVWFGVDHDGDHPNLAATAAVVAERASPHSRAALIAHIDSALTQLDDVARHVEHHGRLAEQSRLHMMNVGFRA